MENKPPLLKNASPCFKDKEMKELYRKYIGESYQTFIEESYRIFKQRGKNIKTCQLCSLSHFTHPICMLYKHILEKEGNLE